MVELENWKTIIVPQRRESGCIPTGYEWLIRYLNIQRVDFRNFQEEFDFGQSNSFDYVAARIKSKYPAVSIQIMHFSQGVKKIDYIRSLIEAQTPCLISLALGRGQGWHIMPVVSIDNDKIEMIHDADGNGNHTWAFPVTEVIWKHDNLQGGDDISWIDSS